MRPRGVSPLPLFGGNSSGAPEPDSVDPNAQSSPGVMPFACCSFWPPGSGAYAECVMESKAFGTTDMHCDVLCVYRMRRIVSGQRKHPSPRHSFARSFEHARTTQFWIVLLDSVIRSRDVRVGSFTA